ncbi:MAG: hypothetical protein ABIL09_01590 [Gemmatimonadota bacterium]
MRRRVLASLTGIALGGWLGVPGAAHGQDGYTYSSAESAIIVESPQHWQKWDYQNDLVSGLKVRADSTGLFVYPADGSVYPRYWRGPRNAALDAAQFSYSDKIRGGGAIVSGGIAIAGAGTNGRGNNNSLGSRAIDGDLTTYWEPSASQFYPDSLRNWEVLLDLGRTVVADSIRLVFPTGDDDLEEGDLGDPFRAFAILGGAGRRTGKDKDTTSPFIRFDLFLKATAGDLHPIDPEGKYQAITVAVNPLMVDEPADWNKDGLSDMSSSFLAYVQVKATDSALGRRAFIGADDVGEDAARTAYEALPAERRGDRIYQRKTAGGFFSQVTEAVWNSLPDDRKGPVNYYMRELPRLLEVEVWSKGDNMSYIPERRAGGSFERLNDVVLGSPWLAFDGNAQTEWTANVWSPLYVKGTAWVDLGATFWVDRADFFFKRTTDPVAGAFMGHEVLFSDGTVLNPVNLRTVGDFYLLENAVKWENVIEASKVDNYWNGARVRMFEQTFPMRQARFLQLRNVDIAKQYSGQYGWAGSLGELALYGHGYPVSLWISSPPILLQDASIGQVQKTSLSRISWDGDAVVRRVDPVTGEAVESFEPLSDNPEVTLQVQTRTSQVTGFNITYFQIAGGQQTETDQATYDGLAQEWAIWNYLLKVGGSSAHPSWNQSRTGDDDNDGRTNEDWPDGIDNDKDGQIDEDWYKVRAEPKSTVASDTTLTFEGWSSWSRSYLPTGGVNEAVVTSPSPRKYLQVRVNMSSTNPEKSARIKYVRVDLVRPLAEEMAGELAMLTESGRRRALIEAPDTLDYRPPTGVSPLTPQVFSYFIRAAGPDPLQSQVRNGFDELLITTKEPVALRGVRLGQVATTQRVTSLGDTITSVTRTTFARTYEPVVRAAGDTVFQSSFGDTLALLARPGSDSLWIRLPVSLNRGLTGSTHGVAEVQFAVQTYREGTQFPSFVRYSRDAGTFFQRVEVDNRDATDLVNSQSVRVNLDNTLQGLVHAIEMVPVVTPNGDLVNDELRVKFTVLRILDDVPVEVGFFDLSGARVGEAQLVGTGTTQTEVGEAGQLEFSWDGKDSNGKVVPPGVYLMRIRIDADDAAQEILRTVSVAY